MKPLLFGLIALAGLVSCTSETPAGKLVGALDSSAWDSSVWISAADAPVYEDTCRNDTHPAAGSVWFVSDVANGKQVGTARWMTAGLGVYYLYVNGRRIGEEVLKPGFTHPFKTKRSFTYDVTEVFDRKAGASNRLSVQVTPGWWSDKIVTPKRHIGMVGDKCAFRGVLELTYEDGSVALFGTDTLSWKAGVAGPVKMASIFDGEEYDAGVPMGYDCVRALGKAEVNTEFKGEILPTCGAEIYLRSDLAFKPAGAYVWQGVGGVTDSTFGKVTVLRRYKEGRKMTLVPGETLVVDFGQNCAAVPEFEFKAARGTQLTCLPAEILNDGNGAFSRGMDGPGGSVYRTNLRVPDNCMILKYTFAGKGGYELYHPECTFFGYRYISVTVSAPTTIRAVRSIPVTSISKSLETGSVTTGNELINRLILNTVWGQKSNYLSVPTDCPQRNERLGWTADTQVFAETGTYFADTRGFFHKWMRDLRDSQSPTGAFPGVAPWGQYGRDMMRLGWADAGVIVPWTIWKQYDDTAIIEENWEAMSRFISHVDETKYDHTALSGENRNYQWADWLSYEPLESHGRAAFGPDGKPRPEAVVYWNYLSASYWALDAGMMKDMAAATGRDTSVFADMQERAKAYIRDHFLNSDGSFKLAILNTMQTPSLFILKNGLVGGDAREAVCARLRSLIEAGGKRLSTGFLGTSILMPTLTGNGMADLAYELLFQRKDPSWLYSVDNGATTIWERWNSYTLERGMGPKGMNSFNHYAYGSVCQWIWQTVCGIQSDPAAPGFRHIIMKPVPDRRLGFVEAEYDSAAGLIRSSWKYDGDKWLWKFSVPEGATASVTLPGENEAKEYGPGSWEVEQVIGK